MALWIGKQIPSGDGLFYSRKENFEEKGAKVYMETEVTHVDFDQKTITAKQGDKEWVDSYDKLILATGSRPIDLPIPGTDLENIQFVKLYQNAAEVIEKLQDDQRFKNIAVVGAGYIGVELAEAFQRIGKNVTLIDLAPTVLVQYYDVSDRRSGEFTTFLPDTGQYGLNVRKSGYIFYSAKIITSKNTLKFIGFY